MLSLYRRNMKLYFRDHVGVFFSLLGAIISFVLYILFLKKTMSGDWSSAPNGSQLLDLWLISGTLAVASMTTTLTGISQMVMDKENHVWDDLRLTNLSPAKMVMAYLMSAASIGAVMQMVLLVIMVVYFKLVDSIDLPWKSTPEVLALMIVSSLMMAALNYMIVGFVRRQNTLSLISTIVGTLSGFLVGVYVPIGVLPDAARLIMKLTPGTYVASLYRHYLMKEAVDNAFSNASAAVTTNFAQTMGIGIKWNTLTTITVEWVIVIGLLVALLGLVLVVEFCKREALRSTVVKTVCANR